MPRSACLWRTVQSGCKAGSFSHTPAACLAIYADFTRLFGGDGLSTFFGNISNAGPPVTVAFPSPAGQRVPANTGHRSAPPPLLVTAFELMRVLLIELPQC